ncbi:MAG TPA: uracil-DNA glycosylase family protein [Candidatus Saccharimonadales bacterium]|nr:uracil-DNA glycosylase family protein [Candidatus Saccharimonadales bacterium]
MRFEALSALNDEIRQTETCKDGRPVVINALRPTQRYLIISLDPSAETNKDRDLLVKHSGFEERVLALFEHGDDEPVSVAEVRTHYAQSKQRFVDTFYWTHYSKCHHEGNPGDYWAKKYLQREIELAEPELIIAFGSRVTNFLLGGGTFKQRVNQLLSTPEGIPLIASLHPSRDWNMRRRHEYAFKETWRLIRQQTNYI